MGPSHDTGPRGEQAVCDWLRARGYEPLARNARVGRLELDIVARRGPLVVFCEVKSAQRRAQISPLERISEAKIRRVRKAAAGWLRQHPQPGVRELRLDAAFVWLDGDDAEVRYYEAAF